MWDFITPRNLIDWQREAAFKEMGQRARKLLAEGYASEADSLLDEMAARRQEWQREQDEREAA
jgi:hypothetical protein